MIAYRLRAGYLGGTLLVLTALAGCGEPDKIGPTVPVSGTVTMDDKPLSVGAVNYIPDDTKGNKANVACNATVKDGQYTIQSTSPTGSKAGAPAGWYKVTVTTNVPMGMMEVKADGKGMPTIPTSKGVPIAAKFTDATTTPLRVEVKQGGGPYDLKVTSK